MPDTFARMRQITGTTVEWAANDLVIGHGEIAVELTATGDSRMKIGDGTRRYSALPYVSAQAAAVAWDNISGRPSTFPPSTHVHPPTQVTGLVDAGGKLSLALMPQSIVEKMDFRGLHTPTAGAEYPATPAAGDTWGIDGPAYTFTGGPLAGKTVGEGSAIVFDNNTWFIVGGGPGANPADFVQVSDLVTTTSGPPQAGMVPQLNTSGRLDPSFINVPGQLNFRGTVDITQPPPVGVNGGDYWLVGVAGVAHAGWTGIAGQTLQVNDMVIWNGVVWTFTRTPGAASGFVPIDGSAPMTGPLSLSVNAAPVAAHAIRKDYLDTRIAAIPSAIAQLGFTPLNPANNLSELADDAVARGNLGLGSSATHPAGDFLATINNLSDVPDDSVARSNLGLGGAAVRADTFFLQTAQNLADIPDAALARQNLGVPDLSDIILKSIVDAPGDLIVGSADNEVARLAKGANGQFLRTTAAGLEWATVGGNVGAIRVLATIPGTQGLAGNGAVTPINFSVILQSTPSPPMAAGIFTVPAGAGGLYLVGFNTIYYVDSGSAVFVPILWHAKAAGGTQGYGQQSTTFANWANSSLSLVLDLAAGDTLQCFIRNFSTTSGGNLGRNDNNGGIATTLSICRLV